MGAVAGYTAAGAPILTVDANAAISVAIAAGAGIDGALAATVDGMEAAGTRAVAKVPKETVEGAPAEEIPNKVGTYDAVFFQN